MSLKCPTCKSLLDANYSCKNKHHFFMEDDVLILLDSEFKFNLYKWLSCFNEFKSNKTIKLDFDNLPQAGLLHDRQIWKARIMDLQIIKSLLTHSHQTILDIGSWNGWLAHSLTKLGKNVTAIDYFTHEFDGLKAKNHYTECNWKSIQMNLEDLNSFDYQFDCIILNRSFAYFSDYEKTIQSTKKLLSEKGILIITGINIVKEEAIELQKSKIEFRKKYNQELFFKSSKGYLNKVDLSMLHANEFSTKIYSNWKNRINYISPLKKLVSYYAFYSKIKSK